MSDVNWKAPEAGDPGTPRDVNREEDIVWDGNQPEKYAGQTPEVQEPKKAAKKATRAAKDSDSQE